MSEEEFSASYLFRAHAINLMASINQAVTHLKQPELVIVMMNKLGETHGRRQVERKHFNVTKVVLVGMLQDLKLSADVINSWDKCLDFLFEHIFAKLKIF
ncbi:uncharacterized protein [Choristoneura fumiferana]|uniref:uncharacterized protein n=1 Tax=Choristoneura fumiferana TaxID=7141 RepID=UPI003D15AABB